MSYAVEIRKALGKLGKNGTINPDEKHNTGRGIGEVFLWREVERYAQARLDDAWAALEKEAIIPNKKTLEPGEHELAYSPSFVVVATVTNPVKRFSGDELAQMLAKSKYKVPVSTTKELIDQAKVPTSSMAKLSVIER